MDQVTPEDKEILRDLRECLYTILQNLSLSALEKFELYQMVIERGCKPAGIKPHNHLKLY